MTALLKYVKICVIKFECRNIISSIYRHFRVSTLTGYTRILRDCISSEEYHFEVCSPYYKVETEGPKCFHYIGCLVTCIPSPCAILNMMARLIFSLLITAVEREPNLTRQESYISHEPPTEYPIFPTYSMRET